MLARGVPRKHRLEGRTHCHAPPVVEVRIRRAEPLEVDDGHRRRARETLRGHHAEIRQRREVAGVGLD